MSYHRLPTRVAQPAHILVQTGMAGPAPAPFTPTTAFAQAVDPYSWRFSPPGAVYAPYGWGPDFNIGMPFNYTHHMDYVRAPIPGARPVGPMYDVLPAFSGTWSGSLGPASNAQLAGVLAVM